MPDAIIRRFHTIEHGWGTHGHDRAKCTECKEAPVVSVDWFGEDNWSGSYCEKHLGVAMTNREKKLGRPLDVEDRRL